MANKPLKSIKFPNLLDTYTVPQVDDTLAITGAAADAKKVGDEINDIKADLTQNFKSEKINTIKGYYIKTNQNTGANVPLTPTTDKTVQYAIVDCEPGDVFTINGTGGSTPRLWAFIDANGNMVSKAAASETQVDYVLKAPANSAKLILNFGGASANPYAYKGLLIKQEIGNIVKFNNEIADVLSDGGVILNKSLFQNYTIGRSGFNKIGTTGFNFESNNTRITIKPLLNIKGFNSVTVTPLEGYKYKVYIFNEELSKTIMYDSNWILEEKTYELAEYTNVYFTIVITYYSEETKITADEYNGVTIVGLKDLNYRFKNIESDLEKNTDPLPIEKADYVDSYMARFNTSGDISSYLFFTDPHIYRAGISEELVTKLFTLLRKAYYSTQTNFIMCGGDWLQGGDYDIIPGGPTPEQACAQLGFVDGVMRKMFRNYKPIFGNHDGNYKNTALNSNVVTNIMFSEEGKRYYSFVDRNTKYFVFDTGLDTGYTSISEYRKEQLNWFANELLSQKEDHTVLCLHICRARNSASVPYTNHILLTYALACAAAYNKHESFSSLWDSNIYDFTQVTGKIHYAIGGHNHFDDFMLVSGIPVIITANAFTLSYDRPTFDLMLNDYGTNTVYCERVGGGASRIVHCDSIMINSSETLNTELTGATWTTSDDTVATVLDGVVTAVSTGDALIIATDTDGKQEAWIVNVP